MFPFYTPWKHQKTFDFLVFSGGIRWEHWPNIGEALKHWSCRKEVSKKQKRQNAQLLNEYKWFDDIF